MVRLDEGRSLCVVIKRIWLEKLGMGVYILTVE